MSIHMSIHMSTHLILLLACLDLPCVICVQYIANMCCWPRFGRVPGCRSAGKELWPVSSASVPIVPRSTANRNTLRPNQAFS